jgi:hypothetical protein
MRLLVAPDAGKSLDVPLNKTQKRSQGSGIDILWMSLEIGSAVDAVLLFTPIYNVPNYMLPLERSPVSGRIFGHD